MSRAVLMGAAGAALLLTSLGNAALFVAAEEGMPAWRPGIAGVVAVGLAWASMARSSRRSAVRSVLAAVVVLVACVLSFSAWVDALEGQALFSTLIETVRPVDDELAAQFGASPVVTWIEVDALVGLSWAIGLASLLVAAGLGPLARRRRVLGARAGGGRWLLVPFAALGLSGAVAVAPVVVATAALAALWLRWVLHRAAPGDPEEVTPNRASTPA